MKKTWALGLVVTVLSLYGYKLWADGSYSQSPGPQISATGQNYSYPNAASPQAGGTLVNDGVGTFRWSNTPVTTGNASNPFQLIAMTSMTLTQVAQTSATVVGQAVWCGNCASAGAKGTICFSTSTTAQNGFVLSTGTACN